MTKRVFAKPVLLAGVVLLTVAGAALRGRRRRPTRR